MNCAFLCACKMAYIVDLTDNTCTYNLFQLDSFLCKHTVVVAVYKGFAMRNPCFLYYTADYWGVAYVEIIFHLPNEVE